VTEVREMRFEEVIEKLYERYTQAVSKEEKMKKIEEKAKELGFSSVEVEFNEKTVEARAVIELNEVTIDAESYRKLRELSEWLVGESYAVHSLKLLITTEKKEDQDLIGYIQDRAQRIGTKHVTYVRLDDDEYVEYFEIEKDESMQVFVYLLVYNEYSS